MKEGQIDYLPPPLKNLPSESPASLRLTKKEYTVKDSFQLAEEIYEDDPILFMSSLDLSSLFSNIPPDEVIDISINLLFQNTNTVKVL